MAGDVYLPVPACWERAKPEFFFPLAWAVYKTWPSGGVCGALAGLCPRESLGTVHKVMAGQLWGSLAGAARLCQQEGAAQVGRWLQLDFSFPLQCKSCV